MKQTILYFGSFNPIHQGHIALAEWVVEQGLCDELILIVSPQNPLKPSAGQAPEMDRFEMAELACEASKYPDKIKPSAIEFILPRPSYTIDTLRYLDENHSDDRRISVLIGADLLPQLDRWKEYEAILNDYKVYVYPRRDYPIALYTGRITPLNGAPLWDYSSTDIRTRLEQGQSTEGMLTPEVANYIHKKGLWTPEQCLESLTARIEAGEADTALFVERGRIHYSRAEWGEALNDFNRALAIDPEHREAREFARMVQEILEFRYKDIYNP